MRINEIRDIVKRLGVPSACGGIMQMGRFFDQHPDGLYITQGGGPAVAGWDDFSVFVGRVGEMENLRRLEIELYASGKAEGMEITRIGGHYVLSFRTRIAGGGSGVFFGGGSQPVVIDPTWLYFTMPDGGTVTLTKTGSPTAVTLEYSLDNGSTWTEWTESGNVRSLALNAGQTMHVRNTSSTSTGFSTGASNYYQFSFNADTYAGGDIMSLLCSDPSLATMTNHCFRMLFRNATSLITGPILSATTLTSNCCNSTFEGCISLLRIGGFYATTTAMECCSHMLQGCKSLVELPELLPESLAMYAYEAMLNNCESLTEVRTRMTDISAAGCLQNWMAGSSATGDFYCPASLTIPTGASGIPNGWTRHDI